MPVGCLLTAAPRSRTPGQAASAILPVQPLQLLRPLPQRLQEQQRQPLLQQQPPLASQTGHVRDTPTANVSAGSKLKPAQT